MYLTPPEKQLLANIYTLIKNVADTSTALVAYAWGVSPRNVRDIVKRMVESTNMSVERRVRRDAGNTIFNSEKKRKSVFTARFCFNQKKRRENRGEPPTKQELDTSWQEASPQTKAVAEHEAQQLLMRGPMLLYDVRNTLFQTKGSITWRQLTAQVAGGEVSAQEIL